jgi:uncharacterized protein YggT (Ycf19 family)
MGMESILLALELYLLVIAVDVMLGWVQPDPSRWPRRATHVLTEPFQIPLRKVLVPKWTGGLDVSPLVLVAFLGGARVWLLAWF